jgi:hypothetical protein
MNEQVRPVTRAFAVVLVVVILACFLFVLAIGEIPHRPDWGEALGLLIVLPTLIYVAFTGQTPRWIQRLEKARKR